MFHRLSLVAVIFCGYLLCACARAETVAVFLPERSSSAIEFTRLFTLALERKSAAFKVIVVNTLAESAEAQLVIVLGARALQQQLTQPKSPLIVASLLPKASFDPAWRLRASAVFLDHPPERQLRFLRLLLPEAKRVGLLISEAQRKDLQNLQTSAETQGLRLSIETVTGQDPRALNESLNDGLQRLVTKTEVLLAWPDNSIFNPLSIQNILLSTYRQRVPLLGFSAAYTKAGALASLYSSVESLAEQTAEMAQTVLLQNVLPSPQYPKKFEVSFNRQVGRSLGVYLPTEAELIEKIKAQETRP